LVSIWSFRIGNKLSLSHLSLDCQFF